MPANQLTCLLSPRELEVLRLVASGASNAEIAGALALSVHTVKKHVVKVLLKLKVASRSEAALLYRGATSLAEPPAAAPASAPTLEGLTTRERDVLRRMAEGANNQRIASELALSINTVKRHGTRIFSKLGVRSRVCAAALLYVAG